MKHRKSQSAIDSWISLLGRERVIAAEEGLEPYRQNTSGLDRTFPAVIKPETTGEVQEVVRIARRTGTPIYPFACGRNWGYGSRLPTTDGCVLVDLSQMRTVRNLSDLSSTSPIAVVEPGVTQRLLYNAIRTQALPLLFNCTGAGRDTSVLGNALERGFGYLGAKADDLTMLEVVLGNGEIIRTGFGHFENVSTSLLYREGLGPSLGGLFCQSNFGIVTAAGFRLTARRECHAALVTTLEDTRSLPEFIDRLADLRRHGLFETVFHLGSPNRSQMTLGPLVYEHLLENGAAAGAETRQRAREQLAEHRFDAWTGTTGLMGTKSQLDAAFAEIENKLGDIAHVSRIDEAAPRQSGVAEKIHEQLLGLTLGIPSDAALQSPFWVLGRTPDHPSDELDESDVGLLFCCPTLPFNGRAACEVLEVAETVKTSGFEPYVTLNAIDGNTLICVLNIVFRRSDPASTSAAHECIAALYRKFAKRGYYPYRLGIQSMGEFIDDNDPWWATIRSLKNIFDPDNIIAPGRYCPV